MNPVIIDIQEASLSKEVYDSRPHIFFTVFIYGLLVMVIIALAWTYFGHIDIAVRAQGIIRPHTQMALVVNAVQGEVRDVFFHDGKQVKRGDILYTLHTFHLENEKGVLEDQLDTLKHELASLNLYQDSIESGENLIGDFNKELSARFDSFHVNLMATQHISTYNTSIVQSELGDLQETLTNTLFELEMLRLLERSISTKTNLFEVTNRSLSQREGEILNTYTNKYLAYISNLTNLTLQNSNIIEIMEGNIIIIDAIERRLDALPHSTGILYKRIFDEYVLQMKQLEEKYILAESNYLRTKSLYDAGIVSNATMKEGETEYKIALFNMENYSFNFRVKLDTEIKQAENELADSDIQIESFELNSQITISDQILQFETTINSMEQKIVQARLQLESVFLAGEEHGEVAIIRLGEINRTLNQIRTIEQEIATHNSTLARINVQIEESTVKAQIDGEINSHIELVGGSFLMSGVNVMSIVPARDDTLTANIFISNDAIASIEEGMVVRYDIPALPRRDFGEITGNITRISPDVTASDGLQGHFLVESLLEDKVYYDTRGNPAQLRIGMHFEARIVVDRQRILFFLLDQLNLLFN